MLKVTMFIVIINNALSALVKRMEAYHDFLYFVLPAAAKISYSRRVLENNSKYRQC